MKKLFKRLIAFGMAIGSALVAARPMLSISIRGVDPIKSFFGFSNDEPAKIIATALWIASVLGWALISYWVTEGVMWYLSVRDIHLTAHEKCERRFERILNAHALYTNNGTLENTLEVIGKTGREIKYTMARMVSEALSRVFISKGRFEIGNQGYGQFSNTFDSCLIHCSQVVLTCIYAPNMWFSRLKKVSAGAQWDYLGEKNVLVEFTNDENGLKALSDSETEVNRYPKHFISHLRVKEPVRIFLLGKTGKIDQWQQLLTNKTARMKVILPPQDRGNLKTYFVNTQIFCSSVLDNIADSFTSNYLKKRRKEIHKFDINLFDNQACMRWHTDRVIEFIFEGDELTAYVELTRFIIHEVEEDAVKAAHYGIYNPDTLEQLILENI